MSSNSAPFNGPGTPKRNKPIPVFGMGVSPAPASKSIEKVGNKWPILGDLAKLQGLNTISSLVAEQETTTLTSVFTIYTPSSVTPPVGSPAPRESESTFNRRNDPVPPPGHGGGSADVSACPFMALADMAEQNHAKAEASKSGAGGSPGDVAGIIAGISPAGSRGRAFMQPLMRNSGHSMVGSQRASQGGGNGSATGSKTSGSKVSGSKASEAKSSEKTSRYASASGSASQVRPSTPNPKP